MTKTQNLNPELFSKKQKLVSTRDGFAEALVELGEIDKNVVVLSADVSPSTKAVEFKKRFPERHIEVGVAEQNMLGIAAGLAEYGKIPFSVAFAAFQPGRNLDQCRISAAYANNNIKIVGTHAGLSNGKDGATHQALEDIAIMRALPNMIVISPCDAREAKKATLASYSKKGPIYIRLGRNETPIITTQKSLFEIGKANVLRNGTDITLIATGSILYEAILASEIIGGNKKALETLLKRYPKISANIHETKLNGHSKYYAKRAIEWNADKIIAIVKKLDKVSVEVINCHTIKPLDIKTIIESAKKTGLVISIEEHQTICGLGGAIAEALSEHRPTKLIRMGMNSFGESGETLELLEKYQLTAPAIMNTILKNLG